MKQVQDVPIYHPLKYQVQNRPMSRVEPVKSFGEDCADDDQKSTYCREQVRIGSGRC